MDRSKFIKELIDKKYSSLLKFAHVAEIPYTTLKSALSKEDGIGRMSVDNALKIAHTLGIDIDMMSNQKIEPEEQKKSLIKFDPDKILERYYSLPDRSKELVNKVIDHEKLYIQKESECEIPSDDYLVAAHGTEGMNDTELESVKRDIEKAKEILKND